jgi:hypothetical protein
MMYVDCVRSSLLYLYFVMGNNGKNASESLDIEIYIEVGVAVGNMLRLSRSFRQLVKPKGGRADPSANLSKF